MEKSPIDIQVGSQLKKLRLAQGVEVSEIAMALNVSVEKIDAYEAGSERISALHLQKLARVLDVDVTKFFAGMAGVADIATEFSGDERVPIAEALQLLKAFGEIDDASARKHLITQAELLAAQTSPKIGN
jgi:transcriptional regulator with XRE-family HTH domain